MFSSLFLLGAWRESGLGRSYCFTCLFFSWRPGISHADGRGTRRHKYSPTRAFIVVRSRRIHSDISLTPSRKMLQGGGAKSATFASIIDTSRVWQAVISKQSETCGILNLAGRWAPMTDFRQNWLDSSPTSSNFSDGQKCKIWSKFGLWNEAIYVKSEANYRGSPMTVLSYQNLT